MRPTTLRALRHSVHDMAHVSSLSPASTAGGTRFAASLERAILNCLLSLVVFAAERRVVKTQR